MNDTPFEVDEIPEDEMLEEGAPDIRKKGIPPMVKLLFIVGMAVSMVLFGLLYNSNKASEPSSTSRAAALDSTPGGDVQQNSALYQESIQEMNEQRAQRASELGVTSVPTPEVILKPIEDPVEIKTVEIDQDEEEPKEAAAPVVVKRRIISAPKAAPTPVVEQRQRVKIESEKMPEVETTNPNKEPENKYVSLMTSQMGTLARNFASKPMVAQTTSVQSEAETSDMAVTEDSATSDADAETQADLIFRPGDVIYAETLTSVNSDLESPVLVEVVSGEYKGARLVGSYTADDASDRMVVSFTNMTLPDGNVLSVNAYAVDGSTAETAVASDVDRRYVARYAPIIAASFVSGYASSAASTASTVIGTGDDATVATTEATNKQSLYSGLSSAASAISADIMANVPDGPKIILRDGYPIGIIFVDPVEAPAE